MLAVYELDWTVREAGNREHAPFGGRFSLVCGGLLRRRLACQACSFSHGWLT